MTSRSRLLSVVGKFVFIASAVFAGLIGKGLWDRMTEHQGQAFSAVSSSGIPPPQVSDDAALRARIARLEAQLNRGTEPDGGLSTVAADDGGTRFSDNPADRAKRIAFLKQRHAEQIEAHYEEPYDGTWAPEKREQLEAALKQFEAKGKFSMRSVNCRSHSCLAELQWDNFEAAAQSARGLAEGQYLQDCGKVVMMFDPENPKLSYRATVIYDCRRDRNNDRQGDAQ